MAEPIGVNSSENPKIKIRKVRKFRTPHFIHDDEKTSYTKPDYKSLGIRIVENNFCARNYQEDSDDSSATNATSYPSVRSSSRRTTTTGTSDYESSSTASGYDSLYTRTNSSRYM